jgi:hypothetical protein
MKAIQSSALVLAGAVVGGVIGYFVFFWLVARGFYGLIIPGGLLGLGAGAFKNRSTAVAIVCGLAALALGLYTEWRFAPFVVDGSLGYFIAHFYQLRLVTLLMIAAGTAIGFWGPFRRCEKLPATK